MRAIFFLLIVKVALTPAIDVIGHIGTNVILPSGAEPTWSHSKIEWTIFSNKTYIATFRNGIINTERFGQYFGRLSFNVYTGDLTIHNVTKEDAMEYSVYLINKNKESKVNKNKLIVLQRLQKPSIETNVNMIKNGTCEVSLKCTSPNEDVNFSWMVNTSSVTTFRSVKNSELIAFFHKEIQVNFTCISNTTWESASSSVTPKCDVMPTPPPCHRCNPGTIICIGLVLGILIGLMLSSEKFITALKYIKNVLCQSRASN